MEPIRSFIAIELPADLKLELNRLQDKLKTGKQQPVKWVDPQGIHLTLKFLGNIESDIVVKLNSALSEAVRGINPFSLEIKDLGVFPSLNRIQVIWVGLGGDVKQLTNLQQRVEAGLKLLGFTPEARPFTPHLTLGRVSREANSKDKQTLAKLITSTTPEGKLHYTVASLHLMRSQLTRQGAIYSKLSTFPLVP
jgi:2'-5' RNA ligase